MKSGSGVSIPAVLLSLICFFLPWVTVSCNGRELVTLSGYELAAGAEIDASFETSRTEGDALLFTIPLAAIAAGGLGLLAGRSARPNTAVSAASLIITIGAFAILILKWVQLSGDAADNGLTIAMRYGLWGTVLGLIGLLIGVVISFGGSRASPGAGLDGPYDPYSSSGDW